MSWRKGIHDLSYEEKEMLLAFLLYRQRPYEILPELRRMLPTIHGKLFTAKEGE
jgi:hypothetical protein